MRDKLWINRWTERRKESAVSNAKQGISFLGGYNMTDYKNVLFELWVGLNMYKGSPTSCYSNIIPPNGSEVIKVRLSDHRSTENEWGQNELTGYPNRRYSIVIFSMKSMPDESKQDIVETEWQSYLSNGIPIYEKCFNRFYLKDTFPELISILQDIYNGGAPEDNTIKVDLTENKQHKTRYNMKKTIRLTESDLHRIVKRAINEALSDEHFPSSDGHPDIYTHGVMGGNRYKLNYGADYGHKRDSSLLKNGVLNPNAKRTEWMWIKDMVNHANDLFKEYHLHDQDAYDAIEKLNELLKQGVQTSDAVDQIGDDFYKED